MVFELNQEYINKISKITVQEEDMDKIHAKIIGGATPDVPVEDIDEDPEDSVFNEGMRKVLE